MKRVFACLLSFVLLMSCFSGCGAAKKSIRLIIKTPPISMVALNDPDISDTREFLVKAGAAFAEQYEDANVIIDVQEFEYTKENEAIPDSFDTDGAADVLYEGYFNMSTYIHSGRVVPLDDIISKELKADITDSLWEMSSADGKVYMMPYLSLQNIFAYNKQMFAQCGLEKYISDDQGSITSWTLEEWEEILDTLAQNLPDNNYPIMMYAKNNQGDTHIMTLIRSHGCEFFDENGRFSINNEEGTEGLRWILNGIDRGWYPPHCENLEIANNTELFSNNQLAIMLVNNANMPNLDRELYGYVNFPSADGAGLATSFVTGFEVFDNGDPDKVAAAKAFVEFVMESDMWSEYASGGIPAKSSVAQKYQSEVFMLKECVANTVNSVDFTRNNPNWRGVRDVFYKCINDLLSGRKTPEETAEELDKTCNAAIEAGYESSSLHE